MLETERRAHILQWRERAVGEALTQARSRALFHGQGEVGRTEHVIVYSDGTPAGDATAQAILQTVEADYRATQDWFGGITLPPGQEGDDQTTPRTATPVQVLMDPQAGGAYHFGCDATDIYVEPTPELGNGFFVAELVEIFESAINNGWDCGKTNGEGLSRVLAGERNPNLGSLFVQTAQAWWADGHADYVNSNDADDRDQDSNGCATLFLFYLHSQLGFDWRQIVTTGGGSLGQTFQILTGQSPTDGFNDFVGRLATLDQGGQLALPASGNPFPIADVAQVAPSPAAPAVEREPVPATVPTVTELRRESIETWGIAPAASAPVYEEPMVEEVVIEEMYVTPEVASGPPAKPLSEPPPAETWPLPASPVASGASGDGDAPVARALRSTYVASAAASGAAAEPAQPRAARQRDVTSTVILVIVVLIFIVALALIGTLVFSGIL